MVTSSNHSDHLIQLNLIMKNILSILKKNYHKKLQLSLDFTLTPKLVTWQSKLTSYSKPSLKFKVVVVEVVKVEILVILV